MNEEGDLNVFRKDEVPAKSIEGWIIIITNIHGEARDDYIRDVFEKYGQIKNLHLNLDRRTGFLKGYAFLEFENFVDAKRAIDGKHVFHKNAYDMFQCFYRRNGRRNVAQSGNSRRLGIRSGKK
eukprot:XP_002260932.1 hypothetical protein, conserved in Plasmodium species [Plasmodium knowlesi strain H]